VRVCVCVYIQRTYQRGTCDTACSRFRCIGSSTRTPSKLCRQHLEHHYMEVSCKSETALLRTQQVLLRRSRQNPLPSSACQTARQEDGSLPLHMLCMYVCVCMCVCVCVRCVCEGVCMCVREFGGVYIFSQTSQTCLLGVARAGLGAHARKEGLPGA
jgi:hypothetical protein